MPDRDDDQDARLDDQDATNDDQDDWLDDNSDRLDNLEANEAGQDRVDQGQNDRLDDLEEDEVLQVEIDDGQDARLDAVQDSTRGVEAELPGINTPAGAEQRLKLFVPTPDTHMTLGAIGNHDAAQHTFGDGGFSFRTVKNFAAEIHEDTFIDSTEDIVFHTPENLTAVSGKLLHFSTNGDYQLGTLGGLAITAAPGAGFTDPEFTVDPAMPIPDPPAIDTGGPRSTTEGVATAWGAIWKAYDAYSGAKSLKGIVDNGLATGFAKDSIYGKVAGGYSAFNNLRKVYNGVKAAWGGAVAGFNHFSPSEKAGGPGKPKITMYAEDGVTIMSPSKISIFSSVLGAVSIASPNKVGVKAGVSASMKAGCDATVFAFVSAKLESKGIAAVKGKIVSIKGDQTEVIGKKAVHISSGTDIGIVSDGRAQLSAKSQVEIGARGVTIAGSSTVDILSDLNIDLWSKTKIENKAGKEFLVSAGETVELKVKNNDIRITDSKIDFGVGSFVASLDSSSWKCGNTKIQKSEATLKGSIRLG